MKAFFSITILAIFLSCSKNISSSQVEESTSFFVGTYTNGESEGIYKYQINAEGKLSKLGLSAKSENPSFLAKSVDGKFLLAVSEIKSADNAGSIESYSISGDQLDFISRSSSGGAHPCYVAIDKSGYVLAANYSGGNIGLLKMNKQGVLSDLLDVQQHFGKGTTERQKAPHAHSVFFNPYENEILAVDLGTNEVWISSINSTTNKLEPSAQEKIKLAPGDGPRHLAIHPNKQWVYVVNELTSSVAILKKNQESKYDIQSSITTLPENYSENNTCADIHISPDGKFLYASNRGHNSIAIFSINGQDGSLYTLGHELTRGETPRNFSLSPTGKFLLVANQNTNNIVSFLRDPTSGLLEYIDEIEAFKPVCIVF